MTTTERAPMLYRVDTPDGIALVMGKDALWPPHIGISHELIELADPAYLSLGDGMARFRPEVGPSALYGFAHKGDADCDHWDLIR